MKRLSLLLLSAWMTLGLFAQSWDSSVEDTWTQEQATTIFNFQVNVDGTQYALGPNITPNFTIGAFVDGHYRGKATTQSLITGRNNTLYFFNIRVYGLTDSATAQNILDGKEIIFHLYDNDTGIEYILPQTYTFDEETHGSASAPVYFSYTTVTELRLADRDIYPGGEFDLNEGLSLFHGDALVEDGTQVVLNGWRLTSDSPAMPQGYTLDSHTFESCK